MNGEVPEYIKNHPVLLPYLWCLPPVEIQRKLALVNKQNVNFVAVHRGIEMNLMVSVDYKQKCSHQEGNTTDKVLLMWKRTVELLIELWSKLFHHLTNNSRNPNCNVTLEQCKELCFSFRLNILFWKSRKTWTVFVSIFQVSKARECSFSP